MGFVHRLAVSKIAGLTGVVCGAIGMMHPAFIPHPAYLFLALNGRDGAEYFAAPRGCSDVSERIQHVDA